MLVGQLEQDADVLRTGAQTGEAAVHRVLDGLKASMHYKDRR